MSKDKKNKKEEKINETALRFLKRMNLIDDKFIGDSGKGSVIFALTTYIKIAACFSVCLISALLVFSLMQGGNKVSVKSELMPAAETALFMGDDMYFLAYDSGGTYIYAVENGETELIDFVDDYYPAGRALCVTDSVLQVTLLNVKNENVTVYYNLIKEEGAK